MPCTPAFRAAPGSPSPGWKAISRPPSASTTPRRPTPSGSSAPEEDIIHIINGEVWLDDLGRFSHIRTVLQGYYPEPVRLRRIAHWCRYFSGMGSYALKRAILRDNEYYATIVFSRAVRWAVQLAFMLEKQYYPYDKWTYAFFQRLPRLHAPLSPLVDEAVRLATPWERKLELLNRMADVIDHFLVVDGIIQPHPQFAESPTSGYRLLEHAYAETRPRPARRPARPRAGVGADPLGGEPQPICGLVGVWRRGMDC